jgi:hypothetical protein
MADPNSNEVFLDIFVSEDGSPEMAVILAMVTAPRRTADAQLKRLVFAWRENVADGSPSIAGTITDFSEWLLTNYGAQYQVRQMW